MVFGMQKGFNSDIQVRGKAYHIQTEDWGQSNPYLVARIFCQGAVVQTIKVSYDEALRNMSVRQPDAVKTALRQLHNQVIDDLMSGRNP